MTLYKIRRWNDHFENNRSRLIERLSWVSVPNRHDGENYARIMADENAAILFASWVLIVQIASKCTPRGTLIRGDGTPHTDVSLTLKCRCPDAWMRLALDWFVKNTDWVETEEVTCERHPDVNSTSPGRHLPAKEEGGKGGREGSTHADYPEVLIPSQKDWLELCDRYAIPKDRALDEFHKQQGRDRPWQNAKPTEHVKRLKGWVERDRVTREVESPENEKPTPRPAYLQKQLDAFNAELEAKVKKHQEAQAPV